MALAVVLDAEGTLLAYKPPEKVSKADFQFSDQELDLKYRQY